MLIVNLNKAYIDDFIKGARVSLQIYSPWISSFGSKILLELFNMHKNIKIELYFRFNLMDIAQGFVDLQGLNNLKREGCNISFFDSQDLHAKIYIVDRERVVFGSCNFTEKAFTSNFEIATRTGYNDELKKIISQWDFQSISQLKINTMLLELKKIPKEQIERLNYNEKVIDSSTKFLLYRTGIR